VEELVLFTLMSWQEATSLVLEIAWWFWTHVVRTVLSCLALVGLQ
jgi:di/tricarboxylate transporter